MSGRVLFSGINEACRICKLSQLNIFSNLNFDAELSRRQLI